MPSAVNIMVPGMVWYCQTPRATGMASGEAWRHVVTVGLQGSCGTRSASYGNLQAGTQEHGGGGTGYTDYGWTGSATNSSNDVYNQSLPSVGHWALPNGWRGRVMMTQSNEQSNQVGPLNGAQLRLGLGGQAQSHTR